MKIHTILIVTLITTMISATALAQHLEGQVYDEEGAALAYATVTVHDSMDSTWRAGTLTDSLGKFSLSLATEASCYMTIEYLGMQPLVITDALNTQLSPLTLVQSSEQLDEVLIKARRPTLSYKNGTLTYALPENHTAGDTGLDILDAVPMLKLDKDDNVILRGRTAQILIDGKDLQLRGEELQTYLRSLSGDQLKQIEVMTTPSAKYDAQGNSGIVNIVTRSKPQGHFTSLTLRGGYGQNGKISGNVTSSLQAQKLGLSASLSPYYGNSINVKNINRTNTLTGTHFEQTDTWLPETLQLAGSLSANYKVHDDHVTSIFYKSTLSTADETTIGTTLVSGDRIEESGIATTADVQESHTTLGLNHEYVLDTTGSTLSVEYLRVSARESTLGNQENSFSSASTERLFSMGLDNDFRFRTNSFKLDLTKNLLGLAWESGLKYAQVTNNSKQQYLLTEDNRKFIPFTLYDDRYDYREKITAAYLSASGSQGKFSYKAGLRMEHTALEGQSEQFGLNSRSYTDLFPSLSLTYQNETAGNFSISLSRRINRPYYRSLNPAVNFIDLYTYSVGSPLVLPSYSSNMEVNYQRGQLVISAFNNLSMGDIDDILQQDDQNSIVMISPINMASGIERGVELSQGFTPGANSQIDASFYYGYNSATLGSDAEAQTFSGDYYGGSLSYTQEFAEDFSIKLYASASSPAQYGIWTSRFQWYSTISLSWNPEPWSLSFNFYDPFNANMWNSTLDLGHIQGSWINRWESRKAYLTLKYRFGNNKMKNKGRYNKSTRSEESNRI